MSWPIPTPDNHGKWVWFTKDADGYLADEAGVRSTCECGGQLKVTGEAESGAMTRCDRCSLVGMLSDVRLWNQITSEERPQDAVERLLRDFREDD